MKKETSAEIITEIQAAVNKRYSSLLYEHVPYTYDTELLKRILNQAFFDVVKKIEDAKNGGSTL